MSARLTEKTAPGMGSVGPADGIDLVTNLRWNSRKSCWSNDRGYVEYLRPDDPAGARLSGEPVMSIHYWRQKSTLMFEELDTTTMTYTLKARCGSKTYTLETGRFMGLTRYIEVGSELFIMNGYDRALIYSGEERIRDAFFTNKPEAPVPVDMPGSVLGQFGRFALGQFLYAADFTISSVTGMPGSIPYGVGPLNQFTPDPVGGATQVQAEETFAWRYAVSFVTSTNSESPLSDVSATTSIRFVGGVTIGAQVEPVRVALALGSIPKGPKGTVKRRIYRTKNTKKHGPLLYWVADIVDNTTTEFMDCISDGGLGSQAPALVDSVVVPGNLRTGTMFKNHLIATDGKQLFVSQPGRPEQFGAFDYLNLSTNEGGEVTHLHATTSLVYVFREFGVDILVPTDKPDLPFKLQSLTSTVGSLAPRTVVEVPRVGIVFLGSDRRFYVLSGTDVKVVSQVIEDDTLRISRYQMEMACASYSSVDDEYWCHAPVDGQKFNTVGYVLSTTTGAWGIRLNTPAQCMTSLPEGWVAFGSNSQLTQVASATTNSYEANNGVMVWCGVGGGVYYSDNSGEQPVVARSYTPQSYVYETNFMDFGDPEAQKVVKRIKLYGYSLKGSHTVTFSQDYSSEYATTFEMLTTDFETPGEWGVSVIDGGATDDVRTYTQNRWLHDQVVTCIIDVPQLGFEEVSAPSMRREHAKSGTGCRVFKFKLEGSEDIDLSGFEIEFEVNGNRQVYSQGNIPSNKLKRF